ncbi:MAG: sugar-binding transcriptional regulator [Casimicrobiaceae bacterium]
MPEPKYAVSPQPAPSSDLPVRAAWLYYIEGLTQQEVARVMKISRAKVIRLLAGAREQGVVRIRIDAKGPTQLVLEQQLIKAYKLSEVIVAPAPADEGALAAVVGHAVGTYLADQVRDGMALGVGWGATLSMSLKSMGTQTFARFSVISLLGGMTHSRAINPSAVARRIADAFGADCYQLTAPVFVASEATRRALWEEPGLKDLLERARRLDLAVVSVGDVSEESTLFREGLLPRSHLRSLIEAGAVGEVLCHFLDDAGKVIDHSVSRRVVAVGLEELKRAPKIVIAAGGRRKVQAIGAALKATGAQVLITDESAARGLLGI